MTGVRECGPLPTLQRLENEGMMRTGQNRRSIRLQNFDYSANSTYFVTICVKDRSCFLGQISDGLVFLSEAGAMVEREWLRSATIRGELELHSFVVMPNHLHGLISIVPGEAIRAVENVSSSSSKQPKGPDSRSLGSFVIGFKSATTKQFRELSGKSDISLWQRNYWERVVRSEGEFARINEYMMSNPMSWESDRENPDHKKSV